MQGVFYRSDTRDPNTDHMFADGFYKRDVNINDPVFRFPAVRERARHRPGIGGMRDPPFRGAPCSRWVIRRRFLGLSWTWTPPT